MRTTSSKKKSSGTALVALAPEDVRHLLKPARGFDAYAEDLVDLFRQDDETLAAGGVDLDGLLEEVRAYQTLAQAEADAQKQLAALQTTRLLHASNAWHAMLELYARAVAGGRTNASVRASISSLVAFMRKPRKKLKTPTGTPTPVSA